jgi:hypothetical protein
MKRLLFLAGIAALAACATARPVKQLAPWFDVANAENPKYPHARFITGVGSSEVSSDDADARAKANIAAQISSRVKSETSSFQEFTSRTGNTAENVVSRVSVNSEFSRADLIAVVQHEKQGETFYSYAALERKSADGELAQASAADLVRFESAVANSARAHLDHDSGVFGSAAADALSVRPRLDTAFVMRRAIAGHRAVAEEEHYAASLKELIQNLASAREHQVVGVVFTKASGNHLGDLAINAVKHIGLRPDSLSCKDRDEKSRTDATELSVEPEENCTDFSLGEKCEVVIHLVAKACGGSSSGAGTVALVRGVHPSDLVKARESAWRKVTAQAVEAAVRDALKSAVATGTEAP